MSAPQVGDVITTAEEISAAPLDTILVDGSNDVYATVECGVERIGEGWSKAELAATRYGPFTIVALPDHLPRPERIVKAEALREAADAWQTGSWAGDLPAAGATRVALILGMAQRAADYLRTRASAVEAGETR